MTDLLIVADDLTGATDTGVQFARRGIPVRVAMYPAAMPDHGNGDASVLVVDTESRHLDAAGAARRVAEAVRRGREAGVRRFFKKTDSALRGNIGSELEALRAASGSARLAFVPALPALGRTTRAGVQHVHGRPLHHTEFAHDPLDPVRHGSVPEIIRRQVDVPVAVLGVDALDGEREPVLPGEGILVFDAETDEHIRAIVAWLGRREMLGAVAGTAALARALAEAATDRRNPEPLPFRPPRPAAPMLVAGGSINPVSLAQLDHAAARGFASVPLPAGTLVEAAGHASAAARNAVGAAAGHLAAGRSVLLRGASGPADVEACLARGARLGLSATELHLRIADSLGHIVRAVLDEHEVEVLTVLGGDTLAGLVRALGRPALLPRWEVLPGVPVSELAGIRGMLVVSKAGGFGATDVLTQIRNVLSQPTTE